MTSGHAEAGDGQAVPEAQAEDDRVDAMVPGGTGEIDRVEGVGRVAPSDITSDGKHATAFRTIGEVARALNIAPHVLRYWEEQFPMLRPVKRSGSRRYYRPEDIALLEEIHRLVHRQGYTLRGARQHLESRDRARPGKAAAPGKTPAPRPPSLLEGLIALREDLAGLLKG